jgi:hypothetical protein
MDPLTIAFGVISTAASVSQASEQRKAGKAAQRQYEAEQRRAEVQNIRSVRQQIREARLAQASMTNVAAQTGGMGGSAVAGGVSSVGTQLAGNLNYMQQIAKENTAIGAAAVEGAQAISNAAVYGSVGKISGTIFSEMGGYQQLTKALKKL